MLSRWEAHALFKEAECEVPGEKLESLNVDLLYLSIDGRSHHRLLRSRQTYMSAAGPVTVERTLYRAGKGRSVGPMELRAGIVEGRWRRGRRATWSVS